MNQQGYDRNETASVTSKGFQGQQATEPQRQVAEALENVGSAQRYTVELVANLRSRLTAVLRDEKEATASGQTPIRDYVPLARQIQDKCEMQASINEDLSSILHLLELP